MFELLNEQRKCFGLNPVIEHWECIEVKSSPYDNYKTYLYLDGDRVVKCVLVGESYYCESELYEKVNTERTHLLPKTAKGKPVALSSSNILKRTGIGMKLCYKDKNIHLYNEKTECSYYFNAYINDEVCDMESFSLWVAQWCNETTEDDIADILAFSRKDRRHIRYQEGDVFRFKIGRRLYGYGRILLDYDAMRKRKEPFWDILMSKPLVCSVYHIITEHKDISIDELKKLKSLPSTVIADNSLNYGEYSIIGNIPVTQNEDYPIMYGGSVMVGEKAVCYQQGAVFRKIENGEILYTGFTNNGVSFNLNVRLDILAQCIKYSTNDPYWELYYPYWVERDLRNPKNAQKLKKIQHQFGLCD